MTTDYGLFSTQQNLASVLDDRNWQPSEPLMGEQEYIPENCELLFSGKMTKKQQQKKKYKKNNNTPLGQFLMIETGNPLILDFWRVKVHTCRL